VPADDKDNARLIVSQIVVHAMEQLHLAYPKTTPEREQELKLIRKELSS
jgi:precorrin-2 methylase